MDRFGLFLNCLNIIVALLLQNWLAALGWITSVFWLLAYAQEKYGGEV